MKLHYFEYGVQKEPLEMFYATCSETFHCIYMEALVLEFLFNKVEGFKAWNFIKTDSNTGVFLWILLNF